MRPPSARILVVEDDIASRRMVEDLFVSEGFDVTAAVNGAEALRHMRHHAPDLIVLDLILPWVNGVEVLATIREDHKLAKVPVVVTTATATTQYDLRSFQPVEVMRKPFDPEDLVAAAQRLLSPQRVSHRAKSI